MQIYRRATLAYGALSSRLGDDSFLFENRCSVCSMYFNDGHFLKNVSCVGFCNMLPIALSSMQANKFGRNLSRACPVYTSCFTCECFY